MTELLVFESSRVQGRAMVAVPVSCPAAAWPRSGTGSESVSVKAAAWTPGRTLGQAYLLVAW